jgi:glycosyltransferase involved in cell wall biosynthesis
MDPLPLPLSTDTAVDITFFIPCYNEAEDVVPTICTVLTTMDEVSLSYEIIVMDDASSDNSVKVVREFMEANPDLPILLHQQTFNQNLGFNFAEAAFLGRGKYFKQLNGKNDISVEDLKILLGKIGTADMIMPCYDFTHRPLYRRFFSTFFLVLVNAINGRHIRYYNGMPIFLRQDVLRWHARTHGYGYQAVLVSRLLQQGRTFIEIEINFRDRQRGKSKIFRLCNFFTVVYSLIEIIAIRLTRLCYK